MITERRSTGRASSIPGGLAVGAVISILATVFVSAIGAHLVSSEMLPQEQIGYCSIAALMTATILGAVAASGKVKRRKPVVCMLSGLTYYGILLAITALFFGGQYEGMGVTLIIVFLGSGAAALITSKEKKGKASYKRKKIRR